MIIGLFDINLPFDLLQLFQKKVDEIGESPSNIQSCDFDSTLSICSDEGCGSKAPGLVARLMGLDLIYLALGCLLCKCFGYL